jgi:hypothetical protein
MPDFRIGFGSDFTLKNQRVGVGTADPRATLDVVGTLKGDLNITGVTTLTSYAGFVPQKQSGDGVLLQQKSIQYQKTLLLDVGKTFTVSIWVYSQYWNIRKRKYRSSFLCSQWWY